jgi:NAD-dependent dihydropyrimidine dehydrogenase PreA subunit
MPAFEEEIDEALDEGLKIHPSRGPRGFVGKNGKLAGLETIHCISVFDAEHRFNPVFEPGSESVLDCDTAILAIGQTSDTSFLKPQDGIEVTRQGTVKIDPDTLKTTAPGVFAAGDIAFGPRLIDRYLQGATWKPKPQYVQITVLDHHQMATNYDEYSRLTVPTISLDRRTGVAEVETGYTEEQAREEASRCLKCWINTIFDGNETRGSECILCGGCVDVCPENCLTLVPLSQLSISEVDKPRILDTVGADPITFQHLTPSDLLSSRGSVMVKDETICIRCGLCAERCPAHTITMEGFEVFDHDPDGIQEETRENEYAR